MKLKKKIASLVFAASFAALGFQAYADDATQIATKMLELNVPEYSYATIVLDVIEKNGKSEQRVLKEYGGGDNGLKNAVFVFTSPASVRDTRILQSEKTNKEDDKWVYLPSLRTTRRLGSGERSKSFVGTELTYNDMSTRKIGDDTYQMLSEDETVSVTGKNGTVSYKTWKIKETPIKTKAKDVEYAYRNVFIDKETYLPVRYENYDKSNKLLKTMVIEEIEKTSGIKGVYYIRRSVNVVNEITGRQTHVRVKEYKFDEKIPPSYFTQQFLSTGRAK